MRTPEHVAPQPGLGRSEASMSTRYVITECCQAPVRLAFPNFAAECADVVCCRCRATAGRPGAEDSPDVASFLRLSGIPVLRHLWAQA